MRKYILLIILILIAPVALYVWGTQGAGTGIITMSAPVEVEDETGYSDYRISLADSQSWFGGDVLGSDLFDAGAGVFTSGTYSWTAYGTNTIANDANTLKITYVDTANGAYLYLKDAADLSSDLTVNQLYKLQFDAKINTGSCWAGIGRTGSNIWAKIENTTFQTFTIYFVADNATTNKMQMTSMGAGEIIWLDNITIQAVTSPADYADSGALLMVCDSGGTDAANCATGYIGEAGTGETLGSELLSNPSFDADTTGWGAYSSAILASVAGGVSNNALRITEGGANNPYTESHPTTTIGKEYRMSVWVKQGTESTYRAYVYSLGGYGDIGINTNTEATASWVWKGPFYGAAGDTSPKPILRQYASSGSGTTIFFDEVSFKEVTEPWPNAVKIYKESHLATEGWLTIGGSFAANDINTFQIYQ